MIFFNFFLISSYFNVVVAVYWKHLSWSLTLFSLHLYFYPVRRIYIWSTTNQIYFMTFFIKQINTIFLFYNEITTFHRYFQQNLTSIKTRFTKFFDNFICFIIVMMISSSSLFECITRSSSVSLEQIKLKGTNYSTNIWWFQPK